MMCASALERKPSVSPNNFLYSVFKLAKIADNVPFRDGNVVTFLVRNTFFYSILHQIDPKILANKQFAVIQNPALGGLGCSVAGFFDKKQNFHPLHTDTRKVRSKKSSPLNEPSIEETRYLDSLDIRAATVFMVFPVMLKERLSTVFVAIDLGSERYTFMTVDYISLEVMREFVNKQIPVVINLGPNVPYQEATTLPLRFRYEEMRIPFTIDGSVENGTRLSFI